ncbi:MAG: hypothetical protein Tsb0034_24350 [Ekhidna sp.]
MEPLSLSDVKECIRWIDPKLHIPARVLTLWIKKVDNLLPGEIRDDQVEYVIAAELKKNKLDHAPSARSSALALLLLKSAQELKETIFAEDLESQIKLDSIKNQESLEELDQFQTLLVRKKYQTTVNVHPIVIPLLIDQALRWIVLYFAGLGSLNYGEIPFIVLQIIAIPFITLSIVYFTNKRNEKHNQQLIKRLKLEEKVNLRLQGSSSFYFFLSLIISVAATVSVIVWADSNPSDSILILFFTILIWIIFLTIYQNMASSRVNEQSIISQTNEVVDFSSKLGPDENDNVIVKIREQLSSLVGRLDAYILESALFGALAFSGFLQIMAENLVSFQNLEDFANNVLNIIKGVILFQPELINYSFLKEKPALFSLVSVETLICSLLFLGVIASRLRFSNVADVVRYHIETAAAYNQKEEIIIHQDHKSMDDERVRSINAKIHDHLYQAQNLLTSMNSITSFMRFLRNGGLLVFLIILISSALLISGILSLIFIFFSTAVFIYFNRNAINEWLRSIRFSAQYVVLNYSRYFIISSICLFLLATVTSIYLKWGYHLILINLAFILFFLYRVIFIFMIPFPEDKSFEGSSQPPKWVKILWGGGEMFLIIGYFLFISNFPGAGPMIGIGMILAAIGSFLISIQYSKNRVSGFVIGGSLAASFLFLGFRSLALPGNALLLFIATLLGLISLASYYRKKSTFHRNIVSLLAGMLILVTYFSTSHRYHRMAINLRTTDIAYIKQISEVLRDIYFFDVFKDENTYNETIRAATRLINDDDLENSFIRGHLAANMYLNLETYYFRNKSIEFSVLSQEKANELLRVCIALDSTIINQKENLTEVQNFIRTLPE